MNYSKRDLGLFILRFVLGMVFAVHGYQKLANLEGTTGFFSQIGIPLANIAALLVGVVEFLGGVFLILGLFTKISSILIAIVMATAIVVVHIPNGFTGQGGYEYPLLALGSALAIAMLGMGSISIKSFFSKKN